MLDYQKFLKENPEGTFVTVEGSKPHCRIFHYLWGEETKAWFCTSNKKSVYRQMRNNPEVAFTTWNATSLDVVTVYGKAVFIDAPAAKERALKSLALVREIFKSADNPDLEIFYIDVERVETFDYANGPRRAFSYE